MYIGGQTKKINGNKWSFDGWISNTHGALLRVTSSVQSDLEPHIQDMQ